MSIEFTQDLDTSLFAETDQFSPHLPILLLEDPL